LKRAGTFVLGLVTGAIFAVAGTAVSQEDDAARGFATRVLYAIAQLAADTERNAARISALADRVDDLEEMLKKEAKTAQQ
jgi:hypothetical protein